MASDVDASEEVDLAAVGLLIKASFSRGLAAERDCLGFKLIDDGNA
jgi:hypothetical protein